MVSQIYLLELQLNKANTEAPFLDLHFVCLFVLRLNIPLNNFPSCQDGATTSWVIKQYFRGVKCLAQGHNTAAVGFEPPTSRFGVRHSTTEPPRSPWICIYLFQMDLFHLKFMISAMTLILIYSKFSIFGW